MIKRNMISVRLPEEIYDELKNESELSGQSQTHIITRALKLELEQRKRFRNAVKEAGGLQKFLIDISKSDGKEEGFDEEGLNTFISFLDSMGIK